MLLKIAKAPKGHHVFIIDNAAQLKTLTFSKEEILFAEQQIKNEKGIIHLNRWDTQIFLIHTAPQKELYKTKEAYRKKGAQLQKQLAALALKEITISNHSAEPMAAYLLAEGLILSGYQFLKYKSDAKKLTNDLTEIAFEKQSMTLKDLKQLQAVCDAVYHVRNLVNEPLSYLTAEQLSKDITELVREAGFKVSVLGKAKLEQLGMGAYWL